MKKLLLTIAAVALTQIAHAGSEDKTNVYFNPVGLALGTLNLGADFAIAPNWTVGAFAGYVNLNLDKSGSLTEEVKIKGYTAGARGNWFMNGTFTDGLYVSPIAMYLNVKGETANNQGNLDADGNGTYIGGMVGYGWFWDSFNMMLGAGALTPLGDSKIKFQDQTGGPAEEKTIYSTVSAELNLGWTF